MLKQFHRICRLIKIIGRRRVYVLVALSVLGAIFEAIGIGIILPALDLLVNPEKVVEKYGDFEFFGHIGSYQLVPLGALAIFLIFVTKNIYLSFLIHFQSRVVWNRYAEASRNILRYYMIKDYDFHLKRNSSTLITNIQSSTRQVFVTSLLSLVLMASEIMVIFTVSATLMIVDLIPTLIVAGIFSFIAIAYYLFIQRRIAQWGDRTLMHYEKALLWLNQSLGAIKEIKISGGENYFIDMFSSHNRSSANFSRKISVANQLPRFILETMAIGLLMVVVVISFSTGISLQENLPVIGVFVVAGMRLMPAVGRTAMYMGNLRYGDAALDRVYNELIESDRETKVPMDALDGGDPREPFIFKSEISFKNGSFRYEDTEENVLSDINIDIRKGQMVAFVGSSGAGKSTLADLLLGILQPSTGEITIDGLPLKPRLRAWQNQIAYIPQDIFLIDGTVRQNIALGIRGEDIDDLRLQVAVEKSHLAKTIHDLPEGLETVVGERGIRLSGGQRQRIGIARALYRNAGFLVMDEPTSALDLETEHVITQAIGELRGHLTIILIAHRLSTVKDCDCIYFMDAGRITDTGTFNELLQTNENFQGMVKRMKVGEPD